MINSLVAFRLSLAPDALKPSNTRLLFTSYTANQARKNLIVNSNSYKHRKKTAWKTALSLCSCMSIHEPTITQRLDLSLEAVAKKTGGAG
jgi:hypothetical protein